MREIIERLEEGSGSSSYESFEGLVKSRLESVGRDIKFALNHVDNPSEVVESVITALGALADVLSYVSRSHDKVKADKIIKNIKGAAMDLVSKVRTL